jgi:hypothetical protein
MDVNGKFAKICRDEIFKGLHIIFVESGIGNYYFNYAHNCNAGIKKAMEYNPKWIVLSNDDMYKIDDVKVLVNELSKLDNKYINIVFMKESYIGYITKYNIFNYFINVFYLLFRRYFNQLKIETKLISKFNVKYMVRCEKNFKIILRFFNNLLKLKIQNTDFIRIFDFVIFNLNLFKKYENFYFDETFINGIEDVDLSFKIKINKLKYSIIEYKIGTIGGKSLKDGEPRFIRNTIGDIYFSFKFEKLYIHNFYK